jgi:hypothetical protein
MNRCVVYLWLIAAAVDYCPWILPALSLVTIAALLTFYKSAREGESMTHDEINRRDGDLYAVAMRLVAEKISPEALGLLWTVHQMYEWDCPAHANGEECCLDVLLANAGPPVASRQIDNLATIILAGYDITIESAGDDRSGQIDIYLSYTGQPPSDELRFAAAPVTLGDGIEKARRYAVSFPQVSK